jgi:hypothetical protein
VVTQVHGPQRKQGLLAPLSLSQEAGFLFGVTFVFVGMLGFAIGVGQYAFHGKEGNKVIKLFSVNALHNIVHLVVGAVLLAGVIGGYFASRVINGLVGLVYLVIGIVGWFVINTSLNVIALNNWDNVLHMASGLALLAAAGAPAPRPRAETG